MNADEHQFIAAREHKERKGTGVNAKTQRRNNARLFDATILERRCVWPPAAARPNYFTRCGWVCDHSRAPLAATWRLCAFALKLISLTQKRGRISQNLARNSPRLT
jgi:hypothetical protein